jgi:fucose permease
MLATIHDANAVVSGGASKDGGSDEHSPLIKDNEDQQNKHVSKKSKNKSKKKNKDKRASSVAIFPFYHPKREPYRWIVLFVICLFSIGSYFAYDSVGVVQKQIVQYFGITDGQFGLLYSVYSFPNIILPFFGGFILDYVGLPIGTMITCSLVTIGAFIVAMAPHMDSFWLMLVGRFIFGVGAETSYVAQNTIVVRGSRKAGFYLSLWG